MTILVTGATGNVGGEVLQALAAAGQPVRALVREPGDLPDEQAVGDLNQPASLTAALDGVRGVFLLPGYGDMPGLTATFARAGVERGRRDQGVDGAWARGPGLLTHGARGATAR